MTDAKLRAMLSRIKRNLRVTKIVATRAVKHRHGDSFAGFSAACESVQDDSGGQGSTLVDTMDDEEGVSAQGMTLLESRIAHLLLALQADISATEAAMAGGGISPEECQDRIRMYKHNYGKLLRSAAGNSHE